MILDLLKYICNKLDENKIQYMLSGSLAYNLYSIPRMTRDIDFVIHIENKDIPKFINAFNSRFYLNENTISKEVNNKGFFNIIDNETGFKIDFIVRKNIEYRKNEFERRIKTNELGFEGWVVSIEDLIISKLLWIQDYQSEKQIEDIKNLLLNPDVEKKYIKNWINKLNIRTFNIKI